MPCGNWLPKSIANAIVENEFANAIVEEEFANAIVEELANAIARVSKEVTCSLSAIV